MQRQEHTQEVATFSLGPFEREELTDAIMDYLDDTELEGDELQTIKRILVDAMETGKITLDSKSASLVEMILTEMEAMPNSDFEVELESRFPLR